jgi:predicted aspartyl protease
MYSERSKILRSFLIILLLQFTAFTVVNGCEEQSITVKKELPAQLKSHFKFIGGLMFVEVTINGAKGLLLVDTGSNAFIVLNSDYFLSTSTNQTMVGMGGEQGLQQVNIEGLEWENLKLKPQTLPAIKMTQLNTGTEEKVLGLIGSAFFNSYQLTLNFASRELNLNKTKVEAPIVKGISPIIKLPFVLISGFPVVEVNIAGKNHQFVMDTGATDNVIDQSFEQEFSNIWKQTAAVSMSEGSGNGGIVRRGVLDRLQIGGLNMDKIQMGLNQMPDFDKEKAISGILGFQFLKYFYVDINYVDKTMQFYDMAVLMQNQKK